jgi:hypothetical protein
MSASPSLSSFEQNGGARMADPRKDFEELLRFFDSHGAKVVIVGAHAVAYHAKPRYTKDLDLLIEATAENARRVLAALADFGFGDLNLTVEDFTKPGTIVQLGFPPSRIDLMTSIDGVEFAEVWVGRVEGKYGSARASFIGRDELIRNKRASGRPQDLADLDWLDKS